MTEKLAYFQKCGNHTQSSQSLQWDSVTQIFVVSVPTTLAILLKIWNHTGWMIDLNLMLKLENTT